MMLWLALALSLGACDDRSPGLSKCIEYKHSNGAVSCKAVCYLVTKPDGGTTGYTVKAEKMPDEPTCRLELQRQATNGCKP